MTKALTTEVESLPAATWIGVVVAKLIVTLEKRDPGLIAEIREGLAAELEHLPAAGPQARDPEIREAIDLAVTWLGQVEDLASLPADAEREEDQQ